jgi:hypothetical protein
MQGRRRPNDAPVRQAADLVQGRDRARDRLGRREAAQQDRGQYHVGRPAAESGCDLRPGGELRECALRCGIEGKLCDRHLLILPSSFVSMWTAKSPAT